MANSGRTDLPILILSVLAVAIAGGISVITMTHGSDKNAVYNQSIPNDMADEAARAGLEAAKWNIECHGRTKSGGLGPRFHINGATYSVCWDDMNIADSTVLVHSLGDYEVGLNQNYQVFMESKIKIEFLPGCTNAILTSYYSERAGINSEFSAQ
jgi:hypothetical protein